MSNYILTTEEVRDLIDDDNFGVLDFDRWLAAHDSEIRNVAELDALTAAELLMKQREAEIRADERERIATDLEIRLDGWYDQSDPLNPDAPANFRKYQTWIDLDEALAVVNRDEEALTYLRAERAGEQA